MIRVNFPGSAVPFVVRILGLDTSIAIVDFNKWIYIELTEFQIMELSKITIEKSLEHIRELSEKDLEDGIKNQIKNRKQMCFEVLASIASAIEII